MAKNNWSAFYIDGTEKKALRRLAAEEETSMSQVLRQLIEREAKAKGLWLPAQAQGINKEVA